MKERLFPHIEKGLTSSLGQSVKIIDEKRLGGGCINHATKLQTNQGHFFLKYNAAQVDDMFVREAESLTELAQAPTELHIPKVYLVSEKAESLPAYLLTEYLEPPNLVQTKLDEELGRGIAQLHQYQKDQYGFYHHNYCGATSQNNQWSSDWVLFFGQQRIGALVSMIRDRRGMQTADTKVYEQFIAKLPELIGHQPPASLNHGDLWSGNYMHSSRGPALIDPASYYADREFDLALMGMFGGFSDRVWDAYQETYPLPQEWRERHDLYMLYHYLNHFYLFGGGYGQQAMAIARSYVS